MIHKCFKEVARASFLQKPYNVEGSSLSHKPFINQHLIFLCLFEPYFAHCDVSRKEHAGDLLEKPMILCDMSIGHMVNYDIDIQCGSPVAPVKYEVISVIFFLLCLGPEVGNTAMHQIPLGYYPIKGNLGVPTGQIIIKKRTRGV